MELENANKKVKITSYSTNPSTLSRTTDIKFYFFLLSSIKTIKLFRGITSVPLRVTKDAEHKAKPSQLYNSRSVNVEKPTFTAYLLVSGMVYEHLLTHFLKSTL